MSVRAATGEESDTRTAKIAADVLHSVSEECGLDDAVTRATAWSETCGPPSIRCIGTAAGGKRREDGQPEGAVCIAAVSPLRDLSAGPRLRAGGGPAEHHARERRPRAGDPRAVRPERRGGGHRRVFLHAARRVVQRRGRGRRVACAPCGGAAPRSSNIICAVPGVPNGRLTVVAGNRSPIAGNLPYVNGENGARTYPFVKQCAVPLSGAFFGGKPHRPHDPRPARVQRGQEPQTRVPQPPDDGGARGGGTGRWTRTSCSRRGWRRVKCSVPPRLAAAADAGRRFHAGRVRGGGGAAAGRVHPRQRRQRTQFDDPEPHARHERDRAAAADRPRRHPPRGHDGQHPPRDQADRPLHPAADAPVRGASPPAAHGGRRAAGGADQFFRLRPLVGRRRV